MFNGEVRRWFGPLLFTRPGVLHQRSRQFETLSSTSRKDPAQSRADRRYEFDGSHSAIVDRNGGAPALSVRQALSKIVDARGAGLHSFQLQPSPGVSRQGRVTLVTYDKAASKRSDQCLDHHPPPTTGCTLAGGSAQQECINGATDAAPELQTQAAPQRGLMAGPSAGALEFIDASAAAPTFRIATSSSPRRWPPTIDTRCARPRAATTPPGGVHHRGRCAGQCAAPNAA